MRITLTKKLMAGYLFADVLMLILFYTGVSGINNLLNSIAVAVALIINLLLGFFLSRAVSRSVHTLSGIVTELSKGNF